MPAYFLVRPGSESPEALTFAEPEVPSSRHPSGIVRISRGADYAATARTLAELAVEHALAGDAGSARAFADDAAVLLATVDPSRTPAAAPSFLALGRAMLAVSEAHRAEAAFEDAVVAFEASGDRHASAHAQLGLAEALLALHDPRARIILEDAGAIFEDLEDAEAVLAVDLAIRDAEARFQASPRSFAVAFSAPRRPAR